MTSSSFLLFIATLLFLHTKIKLFTKKLEGKARTKRQLMALQDKYLSYTKKAKLHKLIVD